MKPALYEQNLGQHLLQYRKVIESPMHLTDEERGIVVAWAKQIPELRAIFLYVGLAEGIADNVLKLALSIDGIAVWRLAFFLSKRRMWRSAFIASIAVG